LTDHVTSRMSDEVLIETYRIAAAEHGRATESGDYRVGNRAHDRLAKAYRILRGRGPESQAKVLPLLQDSDVGVQAWAAAHAMEFEPAAGEPVLSKLARQPGLISLGAKMTLREWRAGRLRFP